jgi:hypothetical protein
MIQSHDELNMEIADEYGLNCMGEDNEDEDDDEYEDEEHVSIVEDDDDDGGDAVTPPVHVPPTAAPMEIIIKGEGEDPVEMVLEQEAPKVHEVILPDAEPKPLQPYLYTMVMTDSEESPSRMFDDMDDLDDSTEADYDMDEWFL